MTQCAEWRVLMRPYVFRTTKRGPGRIKLRLRITGFIAATIIGLGLTACEPSANTNNANANANVAANTNANANTATANANSNDNRRAPTREEYEREKDRYQREAREAGRTIGTGLNDGWLWVKTRFELAAADDLRDSTINVDVDNGVVTLTGTVASAAQKTKAEQVAKSIEGVTSIRNNLKIAAANSNAPNTNR
jgi:hyperosmotically inducible periplasmic protein